MHHETTEFTNASRVKFLRIFHRKCLARNWLSARANFSPNRFYGPHPHDLDDYIFILYAIVVTEARRVIHQSAFLDGNHLVGIEHVTVKDVERYGRFVSRVSVGGEDLSLALVAAGLAWHYVRYSDDAALARAEADARRKKIGLWAQSVPVAPWEFRRQSRRR